ncbi:CE1759 family FMN reductase [uncultured Actinomyces sp.]|uniref:CE1759 family LLM-partnered FMN reductase n=2 Tax=Gleimia TaxID=2692113 RepID=A0A9W5RF86_9ACTO|nr:CE1759 family FMN reductase [uncultured Actinomyces sp.]EPD31315.1 CE1759 family LLM-partnered FMN reductase [Gleimia europaea ACS-120-V-Col10b]
MSEILVGEAIDSTRDPFTPESRRIVVVSGGLSESGSSARLSRALAEAASNYLSQRGVGADVEVVELRPLAGAITDAMLTMNPATDLAKRLRAVREADGIIAVSPTFQASYSGLFKSFWDLFEDPLSAKPVLLGATGGTARHSLMIDYAMRPLFSYLRMDVLPSAVFAAADDFGDVIDKNDGTRDAPLQERIERAGAAFAKALMARPALGRAEADDRFKNVTPLEEMLGSIG